MRVYRALLGLLPASFRAEYADEMADVFVRRCRETRGLPILALWGGAIWDVGATAFRVHRDHLAQDLRYAVRNFRRAPVFTATSVLVAGIGIAATTATVSITDHVLVRPLPFAEPERLVKLWESHQEYSRLEPSPANYRDWKQTSRSFESMAAFHSISANLVGTGEPVRLDGDAVTANLFPMLGVSPLAGRGFVASDDDPDAPRTLLLSHRLWATRFGADPDAVGRRVAIDDVPYSIIGVMPPGFDFPTREALFWMPMRLAGDDFVDRNNNYLQVVARLRKGVSIQAAAAEMRVVAAQLRKSYPRENADVGVSVIGLRDEISQNARLLLAALSGAALCVLLIACANLANLLLARALIRRKELAVRSALGAGRERLLRQLLTESLLLAAGGGLLGLALASLFVPLLGRLVPTALPIAETPGLDVRLLGIAALATLVTGLGFGVAPSLRGLRGADAAGLREGAREGVGGRRGGFRSVLVVAEITVSVVLLVTSGLLLRALWKVQAVDPGFSTEGVLTLRTTLPRPKYDSAARRYQFFTRVLSEVQGLPGVTRAAYISFLPMVMRGGIWPVDVDGSVAQSPADARTASLRFVTPGFFDALGIPLLMGRDVSDADTSDAPFVAVVSRSFGERYWPGESPLGRHFQFGFHDRTVVGVVGDIRVRGLERSSEPQVYLPPLQVPDGWLLYYDPKDLVVRSSARALVLLPEIRRIVANADPEQPISDVQALSAVVEGDTAPRSLQAAVLGAFAAVAALLAGIGIHGLLSFTVSNRRQEIGVRMALGARSGDILGLVVKEGLLLAAGGVVLGAALALVAGRTLQSLLLGVSPLDWATFLPAMAITLAMTLAGSLLPAIRAAGVDPIQALRAE
jgi:putative ABC transport system permease protein